MIKELMKSALENTVLFTPGELKNLSKTVSLNRNLNTIFKVENTTTLAAAEALKKDSQVIGLNFASAKNPGGGFLKGLFLVSRTGLKEGLLVLLNGSFINSSCNKY